MKRGRGKGTLHLQWTPHATLTELLRFLFLAPMRDADAANMLCHRRRGKTAEQTVSTAALTLGLDEVDRGHAAGSAISH